MKMKELKVYDIKFSGLKNGDYQYDFHVEKDLFDHYGYDEFSACDVAVNVILKKYDNLLEFSLKSDGTVNIPCDISGEYFDQKVEGNLDFIVKFGETFNDDRDDLIILSHQSHTINLAQQVYEMIVLSVPSKRIHPDLNSGKLKTKNLNYIVNYSGKETKEMDPRWEKLKEILTEKKK